MNTWSVPQRERWEQIVILSHRDNITVSYFQKNFKLVDLLLFFSSGKKKLNYHCIFVFRAATQPPTEWSIHLREESRCHSTLTTPISSWWMMGHRVNVELKRFSSEHDWKESLLINQTFRDKVKWLQKRSVTLYICIALVPLLWFIHWVVPFKLTG